VLKNNFIAIIFKQTVYAPNHHRNEIFRCGIIIFLCGLMIYVICVCLRVVVSNTYCVVFLFCFSSSCVPYIASFSGLSILIAPSVFSNERKDMDPLTHIYMTAQYLGLVQTIPPFLGWIFDRSQVMVTVIYQIFNQEMVELCR
jgi:hypothetical protein